MRRKYLIIAHKAHMPRGEGAKNIISRDMSAKNVSFFLTAPIRHQFHSFSSSKIYLLFQSVTRLLFFYQNIP